MKLLKEIYFGEKPINTDGWDHRQTSRAIVFDNENKIAILYVKTFDFPKLPGGGVEDGESLEQTLRRECLEEIGCEVEITGEVGEIIEYREEKKMLQKAYCFLARVIGKKGQLNLTTHEIEQGVEVRWLPIGDALKMFEKEPGENISQFIKQREVAFLETAKKFL